MFEKFCRHLVFRRLKKLERGSLTVRDESGVQTFGDSTADLNVVIDIHNNRFYRDMVLRGGIGVAESLGRSDWECANLTQLVRLFVRNLKSNDMLRGPLAAMQQTTSRFGQFLKRNTIQKAKLNILEHYDLSNEFFELFLDESMAYSSGIFKGTETTLREASIEKFDRACRLLELKPTDHLVEIGTGWGGLAIHAATHYGCRVTTTTISDQQYEFAKERIYSAGLENQIQLVRKDYRELKGKFDKLVSIEMIEAVGHQYFDTFFEKCANLLKPDGDMLLQTITIVDHRFEYHRRSVDFIKQFIFPGGCLPSTTALMNSMTKTTQMRLIRLDDFASHYARTLACWRERFLLKQDAIKELGFDDRFIRLWDYYLAYCEAAFTERHVNVVQMLFANQGSRLESHEGLAPPTSNTPDNTPRCTDKYRSTELSTPGQDSKFNTTESLAHSDQQV